MLKNISDPQHILPWSFVIKWPLSSEKSKIPTYLFSVGFLEYLNTEEKAQNHFFNIIPLDVMEYLTTSKNNIIFPNAGTQSIKLLTWEIQTELK